jgi:molybdopterin/thiamine biosynthesis adenylyltransferase
LGRIGVGSIDVLDGDVFDETNLNRQLLSSHMNLGKSKVVAAYHRMLAVNPLVNLQSHQLFLTAENAKSFVQKCDVVVDCLDSVSSRLLLQQACKDAGIPMVHAALAGWRGRVCIIQPGDDTLNILYENLKQDKGEELEMGCLSFTTALVAAMQASETVKLLLGRVTSTREIIEIDLLTNTFDRIKLLM